MGGSQVVGVKPIARSGTLGKSKPGLQMKESKTADSSDKINVDYRTMIKNGLHTRGRTGSLASPQLGQFGRNFSGVGSSNNDEEEFKHPMEALLDSQMQ